jgi:hypothetical protein
LEEKKGDENYVPFLHMADAERFARFMIQNYTGVDFGKREGAVTAYGQDADVPIPWRKSYIL